MGQYYKPIILKKDKKTPVAFASCYDFGSGAKLMEHSYIGNDFVGFIERQLLNNPQPIVWAGDYADAEPFEDIPKNVTKRMLKENGYYKNDIKELESEGVNLYSVCGYGNVAKLTHDIEFKENENRYNYNFKGVGVNLRESRYIVNHDKKEFVDKSTVPKIVGWGAKINPLPLLTCEGNNRGGGDFRGDEKGLVGSWARDVISLESKRPKGFKKLVFDLVE